LTPSTAADRPTKNPLTQQVAEHLRTLIFERGMVEGDKLPSQAQLAETLGVSRLVVREATRVLEAEGLIHAEQGRNLTVRRPDAAQLGQLFALIVRANGSALPELLDVRRALELESASLAAQHATTANIEQMRAAIERIKKVARSPSTVDAQADADGSFHEALAIATGNRFMVMMTEALAAPLHELRVHSLKGSWLRLGSLEHVISGHEQILECIAQRDPEGAVQAMATHLTDTSTDLQVDAGGLRAVIASS